MSALSKIIMNKKYKFALAAVLALAGAALVGSEFGTATKAQSGEVQAVTDVLTQEAAAVERGDVAALDKLWANSKDVIVFESGGANYGWEDYRNHHLVPELKEFKNTKYSFSNLKVKVDKTTAWATFKYSLAADMGTRKIDSSGVATAILEKLDGKWRIVHWHSSASRRPPAPSPTPKPA